MYLPFSALIFYSSKKIQSNSIIYEAIWFLIHSIFALSIMHNQIFGISKLVDYTSLSILGWYGVLALHVAFVLSRLFSIRKKR